jgi:hypothetical protein
MSSWTLFDPACWAPRSDETPVEYWLSLSPAAPLFGLAWRFAPEVAAHEPVRPRAGVGNWASGLRMSERVEPAPCVAEPEPQPKPEPAAAPPEDLAHPPPAAPPRPQRPRAPRGTRPTRA